MEPNSAHRETMEDSAGARETEEQTRQARDRGKVGPVCIPSATLRMTMEVILVTPGGRVSSNHTF